MSLATGIAAFGALLKVGDGLSPQAFFTIAGVTNISGPGAAVDEAETTSHSTASPHRTFIPTLIDDGEISFACNFDPTHLSHSLTNTYGLAYLFQNRVRRAFQLWANLADGTQQKRQFDGFVKTLGEEYPLDGIQTRDVTIRIVTAPAVV
jgi:hypothetical protein